MSVAIVGVAFAAGLPVLFGRSFDADGTLAARGEAIAAGVFLSARLISRPLRPGRARLAPHHSPDDVLGFTLGSNL